MTVGLRVCRWAWLALAALIVGGALAGSLCAADIPDMVPMPKRYRQTGGLFGLDEKSIFFQKGDRQGEIAADEIKRRILELGGRAGEIKPVSDVAAAGIYVLPVTGAAASRLVETLDLTITADDPGPQGYIIETGPDRLMIVGSDSVGSLYGAMTLRQMMVGQAGGGVSIAAAQVYDRPDYHYRGAVSFERGLQELGGQAADYQAGIDVMMRFKMNVLWDYKSSTDPRWVNAAKRKFYRQMNAYARERGIYAMRGQDSTQLGFAHDKNRPEFKNWDCVHHKRERFYCWSRDELARNRANDLIDLIKACGFSIFFLHPVDGGGVNDPEMWSQRCDRCRQQFGDDRWKASAHQFNLWAQVIRDKGLDLIFTSPIYPYWAGVRYKACKQPKCAAVYKNTVEYWQNLHQAMDPTIIPMIWMGAPARVDQYRSLFEGRPLAIYAHSIRVLGYFGTWHRQNKTNFIGDPRDMLLLTGGHLDTQMTWMNHLCSVEFSWNTEAPGSELFNGIYYDAEKDHTEPKAIIDGWLPRACRALFGRELGNRIAPVYQAGVLPLYIEYPKFGIRTANQYRRKETDASTDPGNTKGGKQMAAPIEDSADRMAGQVAATGRALAALEDAYPYLDSTDRYHRRVFIYFYRRMPIWQLLAKAQFAAKRADELSKAGNRAEAAQVIQQGLAEFDKDRRQIDRILEKTAKEPDLQPLDPLYEPRIKNVQNLLR